MSGVRELLGHFWREHVATWITNLSYGEAQELQLGCTLFDRLFWLPWQFYLNQLVPVGWVFCFLRSTDTLPC